MTSGDILTEIAQYTEIIRALNGSQKAFDISRKRFCQKRRHKLLVKLSKEIDKELASVLKWKMIIPLK
jgi:hypothetical protein